MSPSGLSATAGLSPPRSATALPESGAVPLRGLLLIEKDANRIDRFRPWLPADARLVSAALPSSRPHTHL